MKLIDPADTFDASYNELLRKVREHQRKLESGAAKCWHCAKSKANHLTDQRCSIYVASNVFRYEHENHLTACQEALRLLESLFELTVQ